METITTIRQAAIAWWNSLKIPDQNDFCKTYYNGRYTSALTGREIQAVWLKEVVLKWWDSHHFENKFIMAIKTFGNDYVIDNDVTKFTDYNIMDVYMHLNSFVDKSIVLAEPEPKSDVYRYVWLNINDGKFSNSWSQEEQDKYLSGSIMNEAKSDSKGWKLIKYQCLTDEGFEFYNSMKLK